MADNKMKESKNAESVPAKMARPERSLQFTRKASRLIEQALDEPRDLDEQILRSGLRCLISNQEHLCEAVQHLCSEGSLSLSDRQKAEMAIDLVGELREQVRHLEADYREQYRAMLKLARKVEVLEQDTSQRAETDVGARATKRQRVNAVATKSK